MYRRGLLRLAVILCLVSVPTLGQEPTPPPLPQPNAQGPTLVQQGLAALTGGVELRDVTLTGTSNVASPTGAQSGSITLTATAIGQEQLAFNAPDGTHTDVRDFSGGGRAGRFSAPDGTSGNIPPQSLPGIHPAWFFPAFVMTTASSSSNFAAADLGQEIRNGAAVRHLAVWLQPSGSAPLFQESLQRFTQQDLYLDPASLLPVAMTFRTRPFNPKNPDVPLRPIPTAPHKVEQEIRFSNYQRVQGVTVAFHIQIYINGALVDDIQISSATLNTGVTITALN
jgi:hypothetical protein